MISVREKPDTYALIVTLFTRLFRSGTSDLIILQALTSLGL